MDSFFSKIFGYLDKFIEKIDNLFIRKKNKKKRK